MRSWWIACLWAGLVVCVQSAKWAAPKEHAAHHPPAMETVNRIHKTLTSRHHGQDFLGNAQQVIDRILARGGVKFAFQPKMELIDYEERNGQLLDVFEVDSQDGAVVFRYVTFC